MDLFWKFFIYFFLALYIFDHIQYYRALNSCQLFLGNYTVVLKDEDPNDYIGKIIFISSKTVNYNNYTDPSYNLNVRGAFYQVINKTCISRFINKHIQYDWDYRYQEQCIPFKIGNFTVDSQSFPLPSLRVFIPTKSDLEYFNYSHDNANFFYIDSGYFYNQNITSGEFKNYMNHKSCDKGDQILQFKVFDSSQISVLGLYNGTHITSFDYYSVDFARILEGQVNITDVTNEILLQRKQTIKDVKVVVIVIFIFLFLLKTAFAIFALVVVCILQIHLNAYLVQSFPIDYSAIAISSFVILSLFVYMTRNNFRRLILLISLD